MLTRAQLAEFAERGFLVLAGVVPPDVVDAASAAIDELIKRDPPGPEVRGPYNYFPEAGQAPALAALLTGSPSAATPPERCGGPCTTGSSGPGTIRTGASPFRIPGETMTR